MTNKLELNAETCNNLIDMSKSIDSSNKIVVSEIINHCDIEENLPYLLIMYKFLNVADRDIVFTEDTINKINLVINNQLNINISFNTMYEIIKERKCSPESITFFMNKFCSSLDDQLINWGFSFLKDYKLNFVKR